MAHATEAGGNEASPGHPASDATIRIAPPGLGLAKLTLGQKLWLVFGLFLALWAGHLLLASLSAERDSLAEQTRREALLFENGADGLLVVDESGAVVRANREATRISGYPDGGLTGNQLSTLVPESHRAAHQQLVDDYFANPRVRAMGSDMRIRGRLANGDTVPVDVRLSPMELGGRPHVVVAVRDVSAEIRHKRELEHQATHDALTGLPNRSVFEDRLAQEILGAGHSGLRYLAALPVDKIKLDRSLIGQCEHRHIRVLMQATIDMAHQLGATVTAEGIETPEQVRLLRMLGCDELQGFRFSRPVPADQVWFGTPPEPDGGDDQELAG